MRRKNEQAPQKAFKRFLDDTMDLARQVNVSGAGIRRMASAYMIGGHVGHAPSTTIRHPSKSGTKWLREPTLFLARPDA